MNGTVSLIAVRKNGPTGKILFQGKELAPAQTNHFKRRQLWINTGTPENLRVVVNGKRIDAARRQAAGLHRHRARHLRRLRSVLVVTGSELVRGDRNDRNGPFLARELVRLGLEPASIAIVGDDERELERAFAEGLRADLCVVSGGLGPTHDDRTVELVARAAGVAAARRRGARREIERISRAVAARLHRPYADFEAGVRKQATLPEGAVSLGLAGTAPGLVLAGRRGAVVVLPGPAARAPAALAARARDRAGPPRARARASRRSTASCGSSARASRRSRARSREAGGEPPGVAATICARDFEIHVDLVRARRTALADAFRDAARAAPLQRGRARRRGDRARALPRARLDARDRRVVHRRHGRGAADLGAGLERRLRRRDRRVLERGEGARARRPGARRSSGTARCRPRPRPRWPRARASACGADVAVSVTGIAGPGGGTPEKPVGLVYVHAETPEASHGIEFTYGQDRESIRRRATVAVAPSAAAASDTES